MINKTCILSLFVFCLFNCSILFAQSIRGRVIGKNGKSIPRAKVELVDTLSKIISSVATGEDGDFLFEKIRNKIVLLKVSSLGYKPWGSKRLNVKDGIDIGLISLDEHVQTIKELEIVGRRNLLSQDLDKFVYNVADDPDSKTGKAMDMLFKIPIIDMEGDRNIKVNGQSVKILVDGKPSILFKGNVDIALKSMPADLIQKIEVLTNPSAKYLDQSQGAIINIVTKKKKFEGYTLYLGANATTLANAVGTASATIKSGKLAYSGEYTYWWQHPPNISNALQRLDYQSQNNTSVSGNTKEKGIYAFGYNSISYEIDSLNLINVSIGLNHSSDRSTNGQRNEITNAANSLYRLESFATSKRKSFSPTISLDYQKNFKSNENNLLTFSYRFDNEISKDTSHYSRYDLLTGLNGTDQSFSYARSSEHTGQVDLTLQFKNASTLEAGSKIIFRESLSDNDFLTYEPSKNIFIENPLYLNYLNYRQVVASAYSTYGAQLKSWAYRIGLRAENTSENNDFRSSSIVIDRNYFNVLPSMFISKKLNKKTNLSASYSKRISRPGIYYLNPFINLENPLNVRSGNPRLNPEKLHSFELNMTNNGKFLVRTGLFYRYVNNSFEQVTDLLDDVSYTTYQNIGKRQTFGGRASIDKRFKNFSTSLRFNFTYFNYSSKVAYNQNDGFFYNPEVRLNYSKKDVIRISLQMGYNSSSPTLQGNTKGQPYNFLLVGKDFFKAKLGVSISARNAFIGSLETKNSIIADSFQQINYRSYKQQEFKLNISYGFGKLKESVKNTEKKIQNDDLKNIKMTDIKKSN